ncbi:MAG: esterase/lipase family protein [Thermoguttaceae bacterium]
MSRRVFQVAILVALSLAAWPAAAMGATAPSSLPVLLVHGMIYDLQAEDATWGQAYARQDGGTGWTGMIGHLQACGFAYGGTIRPSRGQIRLGQDLDLAGSTGSPHEARLFVLKFSPYANTDGVGYKAAELAETVRQVCLYTGAPKVRIVAHSAGGLVARVYLENALPGVPYRGDVDRLITIGTPHLGSALAEHWGDFLGTRATSLKPDAPLIRDLNPTLDLPGEVHFASIVVRALAADSHDAGEELDALVDGVFFRQMPPEYLLGGDEVVHVRSQNLRSAPCAARYEQATGRPIQYVMVRVPDPSPGSGSFRAVRVHMAAASDPTVLHLVAGMLNDRASLWRLSRPDRLAAWMDWQARIHASGAIEACALDDHPMSRVSLVRISQFRLASAEQDRRRYEFDGMAWSENPWVPLRKRWTEAGGSLDLIFDQFGRVRGATSTID